MLSKTSQYALRAVLCLARQADEPFVTATYIAEDLGVPANYLSKILHTLGRTGLLVSERGPRGGFHLARRPEEITMADVIEPFEERPADRKCLLGRSRCWDSQPCAAHDRWKSVSEQVQAFFRETTMADLQRSAPMPSRT